MAAQTRLRAAEAERLPDEMLEERYRAAYPTLRKRRLSCKTREEGNVEPSCRERKLLDEKEDST
jgi:hypothetical protein